MLRSPINYRWCDFVDRIYPLGFSIKYITYITRCATRIEIHIDTDSKDHIDGEARGASYYGHCLVFHITSFVSEHFSYTHIPSSSCGIIQPWLCGCVILLITSIQLGFK